MNSPSLVMNAAQLSAFLAREFPQFSCDILEVSEQEAVIRQSIDASHLRPGGTVSGPTMMALADVALYVAILAKIGPVALAVTTDFTCHFLNKPAADQALVAKARLLKQGKRLVIGEVNLYSENRPEAVAHVVATYSVPVAQTG